VKWATPYLERRQDVSWHSWEEFKEELCPQFREIDEQGAARAKVMRLAQGANGATEYWNQYWLIASQTGMDNANLIYYIIWGFKMELQMAWGLAR